jgi:alpha-N-acetylglucosamine transferase
MNSGVFTARPAQATFSAMLAALDRPGVFWRRTDQSFLQHFFPDWHGLPVFDNMLQYAWFNLPELWDWGSIRILHFQYEKPWADHAKARQLAPLIALWRAHAGDGPVPRPEDLPPPPGAKAQ